jgi:hypothetical protein
MEELFWLPSDWLITFPIIIRKIQKAKTTIIKTIRSLIGIFVKSRVVFFLGLTLKSCQQ